MLVVGGGGWCWWRQLDHCQAVAVVLGGNLVRISLSTSRLGSQTVTVSVPVARVACLLQGMLVVVEIAEVSSRVRRSFYSPGGGGGGQWHNQSPTARLFIRRIRRKRRLWRFEPVVTPLARTASGGAGEFRFRELLRGGGGWFSGAWRSEELILLGQDWWRGRRGDGVVQTRSHVNKRSRGGWRWRWNGTVILLQEERVAPAVVVVVSSGGQAQMEPRTQVAGVVVRSHASPRRLTAAPESLLLGWWCKWHTQQE
jgi:hypothetical protein